jgi:hypothetical protein
MSDQQEPHAVRLARLMASSPEVVFADLRTAAEARRSLLHMPDEELETALAQRLDPLIDLGLAQFGRSKSVVARLLATGLAKPSSPSDAARKRGLRVACYGNTGLDYFGSHDLLADLVSARTKASIVANGAEDELAVLLRNPAVGDKALANLYRKEGPFQKLSDERWRDLVDLAAHNTRIVAAGDEKHGPDWGFWEIHKALFEMVTSAPVTENWCRVLHRTLVRVNPPSVVIKTPITATLKNWEDFEVKDHEGKIEEGWYSGLSLAEEFRCIVAALYGTRYVDSSYERAGTPQSATLPERCAYYAGASLTKKEVKKFLARDGAAFLLAFSFNEVAMCTPDLREALGVHGEQPSWLYRSRMEIYARERPYLRAIIARWDTEGDETKDPIGASIDRVQAGVTALSKEIRRLWWLFVGGLLLISWLIQR